MKKKPIWITLIVVVVVLIAVWLAVKAGKHAQAPSNNTGRQNAATNTPVVLPLVKSVDTTQVPSGLPANLPWEKNAQILQNFTTQTSAGKTQSTRAYTSAKTIDDNWSIYSSYIKNNGWIIASSVNQPTIKNLDAGKNGANLDVAMVEDSSGKVTVNVTITQ